MQTEPTIERPHAPRIIGEAVLPGIRAPRSAPERGLVRRIRKAVAEDALTALAEHHGFDKETRAQFCGELVKLGAPPVTPEAAASALERLVHFDPLNADALHPFLIVGTRREDRAIAVARVAEAMHRSGRSVQIMSDAMNAEDDPHLKAAGHRIGCGVKAFDGVSECHSILQKSDLALLSVIEGGVRPPLDRFALQRVEKLCSATGAEPVIVVRPEDASQALGMARIGVRRMILVDTGKPARLGSALSAARRGDIALAEILPADGKDMTLRAASPSELARLLTGAQAG